MKILPHDREKGCKYVSKLHGSELLQNFEKSKCALFNISWLIVWDGSEQVQRPFACQFRDVLRNSVNNRRYYPVLICTIFVESSVKLCKRQSRIKTLPVANRGI